MDKIRLITGLACFVVAVVIFLFTSGARTVYSGIFFTLLGIIMTATARRRTKK